MFTQSNVPGTRRTGFSARCDRESLGRGWSTRAPPAPTGGLRARHRPPGPSRRQGAGVQRAEVPLERGQEAAGAVQQQEGARPRRPHARRRPGGDVRPCDEPLRPAWWQRGPPTMGKATTVDLLGFINVVKE